MMLILNTACAILLHNSNSKLFVACTFLRCLFLCYLKGCEGQELPEPPAEVCGLEKERRRLPSTSIVRVSWFKSFLKGLPMDEGTTKTQSHKCRLYWCLIEFIDWRYSQSCCFVKCGVIGGGSRVGNGISFRKNSAE